MEENATELTAPTSFDVKRALLGKKDMFRPLHVQRTARLADALNRKKVAVDSPLLLLERDGAALALHTRQMIYHHVAQGELNGSHYLATF